MSNIINSDTAAEPVGAYPHARRFGDLLFLSGIGPRKKGAKDIPGVTLNDKGEVIDKNIVTQTKSVVDNIRQVLAASGLGLEHIIDIQVFLTDMKGDFKRFNETYAEIFREHGPTRTTIEVLSLPTPIAVEFKVIAGFPSHD